MTLPPKALTVLCNLKRELLYPELPAPAGTKGHAPAVSVRHSEADASAEESALPDETPRVEVKLQRSPLLSKQRIRRARSTKATFASRIYQRHRGGF